MKSFLLVTIASFLIAGCACQRPLGNIVRAATNLLEPIINTNNGNDGYRFRYATDDQVREEVGSFVNGIWSVRGIVEWLSPDRKMKHTEMYTADDKGYKADLMDEPFTRSGLSPGALASLTG